MRDLVKKKSEEMLKDETQSRNLPKKSKKTKKVKKYKKVEAQEEDIENPTP